MKELENELATLSPPSFSTTNVSEWEREWVPQIKEFYIKLNTN